MGIKYVIRKVLRCEEYEESDTVFIVKRVFNLFGLLIPISTMTRYYNFPGNASENLGWHGGEYRVICYFSSEDAAMKALKTIIDKKKQYKEKRQSLGIVKIIDHKDLSSEADEHQI
jgi:hypothetical protein